MRRESTARRRPSGLRRARIIQAITLLLALVACSPLEVADVSTVPAQAQRSVALEALVPGPLRAHLDNTPMLSLEGDNDFSPDSLTKSERDWYDRLWAAIEHPDQHLNASELAVSDDEYQYARSLFEYNAALLLALRATGDLRLLDEVDRIAEQMRSKLNDGWCRGRGEVVELGRYRAMSSSDGFLNFRRRADRDNVHYCRDTSDLEETLMHGHLAMVMYAYQANRDLDSPSGVDYGERADFWFGYLLNHFEPKWRERSGVRFPDMDFIDTKFCHTFNVFILYHYFMGKRLQDEGLPAANAYLVRALQMSDAMLDTPYVRERQPGGFVQTETPLGEAVVYSFGAPESGADENRLEACPAMYSRYLTAAAVQLRLEGFYRWDDELLGAIATGIAHYVMDRDEVSGVSEAFAAGVTGTSRVEGIPPTTYRDRLDTAQYALTLFPALAAWDASPRIREISMLVYDEVEEEPSRPRRVTIPSSLLLVEHLERVRKR